MKVSPEFKKLVISRLPGRHFSSSSNESSNAQKNAPARGLRRHFYTGVLVAAPVLALFAWEVNPYSSLHQDQLAESTSAQTGSGSGQDFRIPTDNTISGSQISVPTKNPGWVDCSESEVETFSTAPLPQDVILECRDVLVPLHINDPLGRKISISYMQARKRSTPKNATPIFYTSGTYASSIEMITDWAVSNNLAPDFLQKHPVVAIDRRGVGSSSTFLCFDQKEMQLLQDRGVIGHSLSQRTDEVIAASERANAQCSQQMGDKLTGYGIDNAIADIDVVRQALGMNKIAIESRADGAILSLAYAQKYQDHLALLVLDSPQPYGLEPLRSTELKTIAFDHALRKYGQICIRINCPIADNPQEKLRRVVINAAQGKYPGLSDSGIIEAIQVEMLLGSKNINSLVNAIGKDIQDALNGNTTPLLKLGKWEQAVYFTPSQIFARCTIKGPRVTAAQAHQLVEDWTKRFPVIGPTAALSVTQCSGLPGIEDLPQLTRLNVPALLLYGDNDPMIGKGQIDLIKSQLNAAHARYSEVEWEGFGHGVVPHNGACGGAYATKFYDTGVLPQQKVVCPA